MKTILFILLLSFIGCKEIEENTESEIMSVGSLIGVQAKNKTELVEYLKCYETIYGSEEGKPKLTITLLIKETMDSVSVSYKTYEDIPEKSIKVDCPRSLSIKYEECWFIKYEDDEL